MLKKIIAGGRLLASDYSEVAGLQYPKWVLAAVFRIGEIYHLFVKKLYAAPTPRNLPKRLWPDYKMALENFAARFEEVALDAYNGVIHKSASLGLYNIWVRRCEAARNSINRKQGNINPLTIFSKRLQRYWLIEPNPVNIKFRIKSKTSPLKKIKKREVPKVRPTKPIVSSKKI